MGEGKSSATTTSRRGKEDDGGGTRKRKREREGTEREERAATRPIIMSTRVAVRTSLTFPIILLTCVTFSSGSRERKFTYR